MTDHTGSREFNGADFGNRIKLLRALRRMSLEEVGLAAGLTKSHVWELEQGRSRNPTVNAVWGLARALSVSPAAILGLDERTADDRLQLHGGLRIGPRPLLRAGSRPNPARKAVDCLIRRL